MMTVTMNRGDLLALLAGGGHIYRTSHGCGSRTQLAYRVFKKRPSGQCVLDANGKTLAGSITDEQLLDICRDVSDQLLRHISEHQR